MTAVAAPATAVGRPVAGWVCGLSGLLGWARWTPLVLGILVFVMVLPGLFGTFLEGRPAITAWILAWIALGVALILDPGQPPRPQGA